MGLIARNGAIQISRRANAETSYAVFKQLQDNLEKLRKEEKINTELKGLFLRALKSVICFMTSYELEILSQNFRKLFLKLCTT